MWNDATVAAVPEPTRAQQRPSRESGGSPADETPADETPGDETPGDETPEDGPRALDVVGIGNAIVDVLAEVPDRVLADLGLVRGSMELVDLRRAEEIYSAIGPAVEVSGGSAANTVAGVAALGGTSGFVGKVADDDLGNVFVHDMRASGVDLRVVVADADAGDTEVRGTGRSLVLVTGDAERTMATHLGVAGTLGSEDVAGDLVARGSVLYLEGYLWDRPSAKEAMRQAVKIAHDCDRAVALSLSDSFCVERHRRDLLDLVVGEVDVLFGNEHELVRLFDARTFDDALSAAAETGVLVAATCGARGSFVVDGQGPVEVPAAPAPEIIDKTGAGDMYASGFLFGLTHGLEPAECARLGSMCASAVLGHLGARPTHDLAELARAEGLA
ncbi:MAG: adenosine kinase [Acidimicrobiales bacterium]|jgi:sugar/nucleoside kinase (ribokinase family)